MPMVYTPVGAALERAAARRGRPVAIHVCIDTGIGRVGVPLATQPRSSATSAAAARA